MSRFVDNQCKTETEKKRSEIIVYNKCKDSFFSILMQHTYVCVCVCVQRIAGERRMDRSLIAMRIKFNKQFDPKIINSILENRNFLFFISETVAEMSF